MGVFHCPVGAVGIGDETCINCGLCIAGTRAEQRKSAEVVREYLRKNSNKRLNLYRIKKIAVCGKGGVGKSTISAMMATALRDMGYEVLVIDMDESNVGLMLKLGLKGQPKPLMTFLQRFNDGIKADTTWIAEETIKIEDIPEEYIVSNNRLSFMMAGKIEDAFQGCACSLTDIVKIFLSKLEVGSEQIVIVDNEAGVESFGRGLEQNVDTILTIIEPSYESISMAETIRDMSEAMGIPRVKIIINKVPNKKAAEMTIKRLSEKNIRYLGVMENDEKVCEAGLMGTCVEECDAKAKLEKIVTIMLDESEMEYNKI